MSKLDAMRAMREANYEKRMTRAAAAEVRPPTKATPRPVKGAAAPTTSAAEPDRQLCGHRSMNGRTCTREHGHAAKSHRYS